MRVTVKKKDSEVKQEKVTVTAIINLLQVAIIIRDTDLVKTITEHLSRLSTSVYSMYDYSITFLPEDQENIKNLTFNCLWLVGATAVHIATFWHGESLAHLLKINPDLGDKATQNFKMAPIHIAAFRENGTISSKTVVPIPIQAPAATTPVLNPFVASKTGITEPELPIRSATVTPGQ